MLAPVSQRASGVQSQAAKVPSLPQTCAPGAPPAQLQARDNPGMHAVVPEQLQAPNAPSGEQIRTPNGPVPQAQAELSPGAQAVCSTLSAHAVRSKVPTTNQDRKVR